MCLLQCDQVGFTTVWSNSARFAISILVVKIILFFWYSGDQYHRVDGTQLSGWDSHFHCLHSTSSQLVTFAIFKIIGVSQGLRWLPYGAKHLSCSPSPACLLITWTSFPVLVSTHHCPSPICLVHRCSPSMSTSWTLTTWHDIWNLLTPLFNQQWS